ncbi:MAG: response regulator [Armatimonadetes bacterium]|nr:response regulator [Armatimonadota bacterium]
MKMLHCPKCYAEIAEISRKCQYCSTDVMLTEDKSRLTFAKLICQRCNFGNPPEFRFCGKCGGKLMKVCTNCGFETLQEVIYCGRCGTKFPEFEGKEGLTTADTIQMHDPTLLQPLRGERATILVVDDEPYIAKLVQQNLELEGLTVVTAANGKEALDMIDKHRPNLIITDVMMPEMDGFELLRKIKQDPKMTGIQVIMLTVLDAFEDIRRSVVAGAFEYICKPFDPYELIWKTKKALGKYHRWEGT